MKRFINDEGNDAFVGTMEEIRALYGSLKRARTVEHTKFAPLNDAVRFDRHARYELEMDEYGFYTVSRTWAKEPVNKKALVRFIRSEIIERCRELTEKGFECFNHASERDVMINGTVSIPWKKFLKAVETAYESDEGELYLNLGDGVGVWVKSTDHIAVV